MRNFLKMIGPLKKFFDLLAGFTLGFLVLVPISFLTRKDKIVFIGRDNGKFIDNVKYFFIYYHSVEQIDGLDHYFVTRDRETFQTLSKSDLPVVMHPSLKSIIVLLRSRLLVVDNYRWIYGLKYFLAFPAKKIQLWHGVGFKYTGRLRLRLYSNFGFKRKITEFLRLITELIPNYDMFVTTSDFYAKEVFSKSFRIKKILISGYPRNDVLVKDTGSINDLELINTDRDIFHYLNMKRTDGFKIILYAPTFREKPARSEHIDYEQLNEFGKVNRIIFVLKHHPDPRHDLNYNELDNVLWYDNTKDIYPLLHLTDLLITDYSSIYMDYLLLDKPVIFFPYDMQSYLANSGIQFDYDWITPGEKCYSCNELIQKISKILIDGDDDYKDKRQSIRGYAFEHSDFSCSKRVMKALNDEFSGGQ